MRITVVSSYITNSTMLLWGSGFSRKGENNPHRIVLRIKWAVGAESWASCLEHPVPGPYDMVFIVMHEPSGFHLTAWSHSLLFWTLLWVWFLRSELVACCFLHKPVNERSRGSEVGTVGFLLFLLCPSTVCLFPHLPMKAKKSLTNCWTTDCYRMTGFP